MKIRLEHSEPGVAEIRSALEEHALRAGEAVTNLEAEPADEIHEIRTRMKKVRALVKLLPMNRAPKRAKRIKRLIKKLKDELASDRDDYVLQKAFASLDDNANSPEAQTSNPPSSDLIVELLVASEQLRAQIAAIPNNLCKPKRVRKSYLETYRAGRKAMRTAGDEGTPEAFHEWRKRVKELWYQSSTLASWEENVQLVPGAKDLSDTLGELHDLDLLSERFSEFAREQPDEARRKLDERRTKLRSQALEQGSELFARKTKQIAATLDETVEEAAA